MNVPPVVTNNKDMRLLHAKFRSYGWLAMAAVVAPGLLTACTDNEDTPLDEQGELIRFAVAPAAGWQTPQSRGGVAATVSADGRMSIEREDRDEVESRAITTTDNIETIGVFAAYIPDVSTTPEDRTPTYMYNVEVTRTSDWTPAAEYRWPTNTVMGGVSANHGLHINAYSPYVSAAGGAVRALPATDAQGDLMLKYSTPGDASAQQDLLYSTPCNADESPCTLALNHAMAAVAFATGSAMSPCKVVSITIAGVMAEGTLNLETGEWSGAGTPIAMVANTGITLEAADGGDTVAADTPITDSSNAFLLIPQTLADGASVTVTVEKDGVQTDLKASLAGQQLTAGRTVVYHISATL